MNTSSTRLPYPGLRAFERDEADLFFGRDAEVNDLILRLSQTRFLSVLGASGTGKSSLVRTGMLDGLELGLHPAGANWKFCDMAPGGHPIRNLARGLLRLAAEDTDQEEITTEEIEALEWFLRQGPRGIVEWLEEGHLPEDVQLLILVDQFEELFRFLDYEGREVAEAFVKLLINASKDPGGRIHVVITMRSEFLGACVLIPELAETINQGSYLTPRMDRKSCRKAIEGPARMHGTDIEPALVNRLLNDLDRFAPFNGEESDDQLRQLSRRADQLPVMQHVLNRVWQEEAKDGSPGPLRLSTYEALGGIKGALNQHGTEILASLGPDATAGAEKVFRALVDGMTIASAGRRDIKFEDLVRETGLGEAETRRIVNAFRSPEVNFLRPPSDVELVDSTVLDISHESLIRQWSFLSEWLLNEARGAAVINRIADSKALYEAGEGDLLAGLELANIVNWWQQDKPSAEWASRYTDDFEGVESYLRKSENAEAAIQAEKQSRFRRERVRLYMFSGVTTVIAAVALIFFWQSQTRQVEADGMRLVAEKSQADMLEATEALAIDLVQRLELDQTIPLAAKYGLIQNTEAAFQTIAKNRVDDVDFVGQRADFLLASLIAFNRGGYWGEAESYARRLEDLLAERPNGWKSDLDFDIRSSFALAMHHIGGLRLERAAEWIQRGRDKIAMTDPESVAFVGYQAQLVEADMTLAIKQFLFERALRIANQSYDQFIVYLDQITGDKGRNLKSRNPDMFDARRAAVSNMAFAMIKAQRSAADSIRQIDAHLRFEIGYEDLEERASLGLDYLRSEGSAAESVISEAEMVYQFIRGVNENSNDAAAPAAMAEIDRAVRLAEDLSASDPSNRHYRYLLFNTLVVRGDYATDATQFSQATVDLDAALDLLIDMRTQGLSPDRRAWLEPWLFYYRWQLASSREGDQKEQELWERKRLLLSIAALSEYPDQPDATLARVEGLRAFVDLNMFNRDVLTFDVIREGVEMAMAAMEPDNFAGSEPYFWLAQRQYIHDQLIFAGPKKLGEEPWSRAFEIGFAESDRMLEIAPGAYRILSNQSQFNWVAAAERRGQGDLDEAIRLYRKAFDLALRAAKQDRIRIAEKSHTIDMAVKLIRNIVINGKQHFDDADVDRLVRFITEEISVPQNAVIIKSAKRQIDALKKELNDLIEPLAASDKPARQRISARIPGLVKQIEDAFEKTVNSDQKQVVQATTNNADVEAVRAQLRLLDIDQDLMNQGLVYWVRPPIYPSVWQTLDGEDFDAMTDALKGTGYTDQISYIRTTELPFYDNARLVEIQLGTGSRARLIAYLVLNDTEIFQLNGTSPPIHRVNATAPVRLETPHQVAAYLRFFTQYVNAEHGSFSIVESSAEIPFADNVGAEEIERAQKIMRPFVVWPDPDKPGHWLAAATVYYGRALFHAIFELQPTGMPVMKNDTPKATNLKASVTKVSDREAGVRLDGEASGNSVDYGRLRLARHSSDLELALTAIKKSGALSAEEQAATRADFIKPLLEPEFENVFTASDSARNTAAYELLIVDRDPELALRLVTLSTTAQPNNPYFADTQGWALMKLGRHDQAIVDLERALAQVADQAEIRAKLAQSYRIVGRDAEAREQLNTALSLAPNAFWSKFLEDEQAMQNAN